MSTSHVNRPACHVGAKSRFLPRSGVVTEKTAEVSGMISSGVVGRGIDGYESGGCVDTGPDEVSGAIGFFEHEEAASAVAIHRARFRLFRRSFMTSSKFGSGRPSPPTPRHAQNRGWECTDSDKLAPDTWLLHIRSTARGHGGEPPPSHADTSPARSFRPEPG